MSWHNAQLTRPEDNHLTEPANVETSDESGDSLRSRVDRLEQESLEVRRLGDQRVILAELKVAALRAGIVDLDGLKFLDMSQIQLDDDGGLSGGVELVDQLKRTKPWLFTTPSSSSIAKIPPSRPSRQKLATDMTDEEYRVARANIIRNSRI
jgi:hypothetical protein